MKKIKFKGQVIGGHGRWIYGNSLIQNDAGTKYIGDNIAPSKINESNVHEVVHVCPFTNFTDSKGEDIYDGDIISDPKDSSYNNRHLITFSETDRYYHAVLLPFVKGQGCDGFLSQEWIEEFKKEIIGNKFDNPELLNNKKK